MPQRSYQFQRNRFSQKYIILDEGQPAFVAIRDSGIGKGILVLSLGLIGFLVGGALSAMLAVILPNFSIGAACGFLAIAALVLIFCFWPGRSIRFFSSASPREPLWLLREEEAYLPDLVRNFVISGLDLPPFRIENWVPSNGKVAYWELKQPDGSSLTRVVLAKDSVAIQQAAILVENYGRSCCRWRW